MSGPGHRRLRRVTFAVCLTAALVAAEVLTACGAPHAPADTSRLPAAAPSATGSALDPRILNARAAVLTAYNGYIAAETTASQTANYTLPALSKYMADPLLGQWVASVFHIHEIGAVQTGAVVSHPKLVSLDLHGTTGTATVRDCLDQSSINVVDAKTRKPLKFDRVRTVASTATVTLYASGQWLVSAVDAKVVTSC